MEENIIKHIDKAKAGTIFYPDDFNSYGSNDAINIALHRLARLEYIKRLAHGIYAKPYKSKYIGEVYPGAEEIAKAIAKRDKARLLPTGLAAQNKLGLSTQVPMNFVYYTDGPARTIKLEHATITFRKASPKKMALRGKISKLVVMAMTAIGQDNLTDEEENKILNVLQKEKTQDLKHDIKLAPRWIGRIMAKALEE
ncbi:MAG: DUF6088 family protein [Bacteroidales bacterium]|nr:DUF6088 family protein [Bacteroidales bacterium]